MECNATSLCPVPPADYKLVLQSLFPTFCFVNFWPLLMPHRTTEALHKKKRLAVLNIIQIIIYTQPLAPSFKLLLLRFAPFKQLKPNAQLVQLIIRWCIMLSTAEFCASPFGRSKAHACGSMAFDFFQLLRSFQLSFDFQPFLACLINYLDQVDTYICLAVILTKFYRYIDFFVFMFIIA